MATLDRDSHHKRLKVMRSLREWDPTNTNVNSNVEVTLQSEFCSARTYSQERSYYVGEVTTFKAHSQILQCVQEAILKSQQQDLQDTC